MEMLQDARHALRVMRKAPGFTFIVVLLMTLGIGANVAVFAAVHAILLRPLPYREPGQLVFVRENGPADTSRDMRAGMPDFLDWRAQSTSFAGMTGVAPVGFNVTYGGEVERVQAQVVSHDFARVLGVQPALGRFFSADDDRPGDGRVAVVSHGFWQRVFGGRDDVLGRSIELNEQPYVVIGVMPAEFVAPEAADVWVPLGFFTGPMLQWRANHMLEIIARLRPGVSLALAERELNTVAERAWATDVLMRGWTLKITPLTEAMLGPTRAALLTMFGAVLSVMLVVCANVAALLLARGATRRQEIAVRLALGASPGRIARQLLTESGMLAAVGAGLGVLLAYIAMDVIRALAAKQIPHFASLRINVVVLGYALAMAGGAALLFTTPPMLQLFRGRLALRNVRGGGASDPGQALLTKLVAGEVGVSVTLLVLAVLLVASFQRLTRIDPGFSPERVLSFRLTLPAVTYATAVQRLSAYERIRERLTRLPDVQSVGLASSLPFSTLGERRGNSLFVRARHADSRTGALRTDIDRDHAPSADVRYVDAGFFTTLGVRLVRGTLLSATTDGASEAQAVISQTTARRVFPGEDPIGQRIAVGSDAGTWRTIVGVVEDICNRGLGRAAVEEVYLSHQHFPNSSVAFVLRTRREPEALTTLLVREVTPLLAGVAVYDVQAMDDRVGSSIGVQRIAAAVMRGLALVAFVLAVSGLYGVLAYLVARRTHEFGIRMALGARQVDVVAMLLRQAMTIVVLGVVVGLLAGVSGAQLLTDQLHGITAVDPGVLGAVAAMVLVTGALAAYVPAYRASRVDPMVALRLD
jgi:putative ABC transport system permease protein